MAVDHMRARRALAHRASHFIVITAGALDCYKVGTTLHE